MRPPRWLDLRLVIGVLLVLGSVLVGARVVSAADATVPVWAAADDLAVGTVLTADDLVAVDVRLDAAAGGYLSAASRPDGRALARPVRAGELVPRSALDEPTSLVQLALPVQAGFVPPSLRRGQLVDVYAVADPTAGAAGAAGGVDLVVGGAPVQAVSGRTDGVLATPTTTVQVVLAVAADRVPDVLAAVGGRPLVVAVHESVDGGAGSRAGEPAGPAATGDGGATAYPGVLSGGAPTPTPSGAAPPTSAGTAAPTPSAGVPATGSAAAGTPSAGPTG
ncbi:SAF domain-containing protein [Geodermatophilus sp. YIM 151500]|uniref:SAF domain-containing protein n=1 Tax=Geodermatophilus sp. YIM 151500 TaxID=2984531 RepID=UPI0021E46055|nr:SAF domain-containing protein [Geodermatophilus sp. YIM 151500]MCV2488626.1 SAF domain-containing protein [Geodermatophilus sp. YIM 151500]